MSKKRRYKMRIFIVIGLIGMLFFATNSFAGGKGGYHKSSSSSSSWSSGATHVEGYTKKDGTYVQPHERTSTNSTKMDNWSTKGNTNPYTGKKGTKDPFEIDK